jgi:drug/metabolite transporter (DMT)-like permease
MRRAILAILACVSGALALVFAYAWYDRYWLWRDCFNELGRCYDPEGQQVYLEQAGLVWGLCTGISLLLLVLFARRARR